MSHDKELIERIAPIVQAAIDDSPAFPSQQGKQQLAESITELVIARYLAGRGKEAFCFVKVGSDGKYGGASPTPFGPCKTPVFLAPQPAIPEGTVVEETMSSSERAAYAKYNLGSRP